eukprot:1149846-Pelagomonas_calceolata.AAC.2
MCVSNWKGVRWPVQHAVTADLEAGEVGKKLGCYFCVAWKHTCVGWKGSRWPVQQAVTSAGGAGKLPTIPGHTPYFEMFWQKENKSLTEQLPWTSS